MIPVGGYRARGPRRGLRGAHPAVIAAVLGGGLLLVGIISIPMMVVGGTNMMFAAGGNCLNGQSGTTAATTTTEVSPRGKDSIPANYLTIYQQTGQKYGVPWPILAGIGEVESDHGRTNLSGVHSGSNAFGAAGPMQIGIGGAASNVWGGAPVHPASEHVNGVATDGNGDGIASVYEPADAVAGAAKYLLRNGVQGNVRGAIFAYNHLLSYVQDVLSWASTMPRAASRWARSPWPRSAPCWPAAARSRTRPCPPPSLTPGRRSASRISGAVPVPMGSTAPAWS